MIAVPAQAQTTPPPVASGPEWVRKPTVEEVRAAYPPAALAAGVGGVATLACVIQRDGGVGPCQAAADQPAGFGFGKAALSLVPALRIRPQTRNGEPVGGLPVAVPIRFDPPLPPQGAAPALPLGFTAAPSRVEVEAALPRTLLGTARVGLGWMRCTASAGALTGCQPAPLTAGPLDRAAVRLASRFSVSTTFVDGGSSEGAILNVPVAFGAAPSRSASAQTPAFLTWPSPPQVAAAFPTAAREAGLTQVAVQAQCRVAPDGGLGDCVVTHEEPVGVGGAQAAIRLSTLYRVSAWSTDGRPTAGEPVQIGVTLAPTPR